VQRSHHLGSLTADLMPLGDNVFPFGLLSLSSPEFSARLVEMHLAVGLVKAHDVQVARADSLLDAWCVIWRGTVKAFNVSHQQILDARKPRGSTQELSNFSE